MRDFVPQHGCHDPGVVDLLAVHVMIQNQPLPISKIDRSSSNSLKLGINPSNLPLTSAELSPRPFTSAGRVPTAQNS